MTPAPRPLLIGLGWPAGQPGGSKRYLAGLLEGLTARGVAARGLILGPAVDLPPAVTIVGEAHDRLLRRLLAFHRAARRADADVLDVHFALYGLLPVLLGPRRPLVVHFHGPWSVESGAGAVPARVQRAVERAVYRRAGAVVCLSQAFRRRLVEDYRVSPWVVHTLAPGVDRRFCPGDREASRARLGLAGDRWVVMTARRLVPRTGVDVLLDAWDEAQPEDATLLVVGDGSMRDAVADRARRSAADIRVLGEVDDETLVDCYRAADLSVVPSRGLEGFGMVVLESLACGTPVVATDVDGLAEIVSDLDPALLVPPGDATALAARFRQAHDDPASVPDEERCLSFSRSFDWAEVAARHESLYTSVASSSGPRRTRVVFLDHTAALGGGELALARVLPALPVDAHVVLGGSGPLERVLARAGVSVEVLALRDSARTVRRHQVTGVRGLLAAPSAVAYTLRLARRLRRLRPDLVHTNSLKSGLYGSIAGRLAGVPVIWHARDRIAPDYLPPLAVRVLRAVVRRLPHAVIANSQVTADTLGCPATIVHSPVAALTRVADPPPPADGSLRVLMVGRLAPWKGQHVFLEAFARAHPDDGVTAVIAGAALFGEQDFVAELVALIDRLGLAGRVDLVGHVEELEDLFATAQVLVHASTIPEPFGLAVADGMAAGLTVIAAEGGPSELITDGVDGLLYPSGDTEALAAALRRVARDPDLRRGLARNAPQRVAGLRPQDVANRIAAVYEEVRGR